MNRTALGLAVGAGYFLGRTKKLKMALAVGSLVAGKKLNLGPRALGDLVNQQLRNNPQFKEIGDQLREDLRGVGKAASGAMAERQMNALADRLHGRTAQVRDRLSGAVPGTGSAKAGNAEDAEDADEEQEGPEEPEDREAESGDEHPGPRKRTAAKAPAKKAAAQPARAGQAAAKKTAPAKKTAKKTAKKIQGAAGKTAARKTAAAGATTRSRQSKGGDEG